MTVKKILSKDDIRLKINMKDILGRNLPNDSDVIDAIGQKAIDIIVARTQSGKSVSGRKFTKYSKNYDKKGTVDLTLSGDMLGLMDITSSTRNTFSIGWGDQLENNKAFNHDTGDTLPKREFLGLQKQELAELRRFAEGLIDDE